ncbi:MAG: hypothetical protein AAGJ96_08210 [Pseudomonadota bacterium]
MSDSKRPNLVAEAQADKAEVELLMATYNDSTGLTWLWALLFGPIYFWVHGFVALGFAQLALSIVTFGFGILAAPFLAYYAWRQRARKKAENAVAVSKLRG